MRMARRDAVPGVLPGRQDGAVRPLAVDVQSVHKHFGPVHAVRGIALTVGSGEVMAFLGPNGTGKTSTIDMILGLSRPDAGQVEVYGMEPLQAVRKGLVSADCSSRSASSRRICRPSPSSRRCTGSASSSTTPLAGGTLQWGWILNLAVWLAIFVTGAAWSLGRDTARVLHSLDHTPAEGEPTQTDPGRRPSDAQPP